MPSSRIYDVVAAGLAYVDEIHADVPPEFLSRFGIPLGGGRPCPAELLDEIVAALPPPVLHPGGSSGYMLAVAAAQGGRTGYFGKTGRDRVGAAFREDFERRGIPMLCNPYAQAAEATARCLVLCAPTPLFERSFAYHDGCADAFTPADFEGFDFGATAFLLIEALLLQSERSGHAISKLIERAKDSCRVVVSLHGTGGWRARSALARHIAGSAHIVCGNAAEQADFRAATEDGGRGASPPGQWLITTMAEKGAKAESGGETLHVDAVRVNPAEYVNTVGAGDAFLGGFLLAASAGGSLQTALEAGVRSAAEILKMPGGRA